MNSIQGTSGSYGNTVVTPVVESNQGGDKESISSIQFQAPKSYSAQGRAVTLNDYITLIQQNQLGFSFDAVNVWGGEDNLPPVYGQVFVCLKPTGGYILTQSQKQQIDESHPLFGKTIVMTGFRDAAIQQALKDVGAKLGSSVSKNTFLVLVKDLEEDTGKAADAKKLGIKLMTPEEFKAQYL